MEMGGNFCQILELGGTTIKGRKVARKRTTISFLFSFSISINKYPLQHFPI